MLRKYTNDGKEAYKIQAYLVLLHLAFLHFLKNKFSVGSNPALSPSAPFIPTAVAHFACCILVVLAALLFHYFICYDDLLSLMSLLCFGVPWPVPIKDGKPNS